MDTPEDFLVLLVLTALVLLAVVLDSGGTELLNLVGCDGGGGLVVDETDRIDVGLVVVAGDGGWEGFVANGFGEHDGALG